MPVPFPCWVSAPDVLRARPSWASRSTSPPRGSAHRRRGPVADPPPITAEEFARLCDFLYRRTGMTFTENQRYYVDRRVAERMAATRSSTFASYFARLRGDV